MSVRRKLFTTAAAVTLLGTPLVMASSASAASAESAGGASAAATSCIGGAWKYDKPSGWGYAPTGSGYYVTTNRCADIQVKPDQNTVIRLCYLKNRDPGKEVCKGEVTVKTGKWTVLGTDFENGAYFYFKFPNTDAHKTGLVAA
ncbi:hypothetical protein [Embleya hyalina]|uniref:Secreted protein n=1 Tax=Embleya hyalina TaxID=516124 RepID=A0A401YVH3_9ACTN|nr:hypothetical protein [Embleya hyalina]GCD98571.1 hypothetical protein EHYA_06282 [Embleya hyalina]